MADNDWAKRGEQLAMEEWRMANPMAPIEEFYSMINVGSDVVSPTVDVPSVNSYAGIGKPNVANPTTEAYNSILGNSDPLSMDGIFGSTQNGMTSSGWLSPAYKGAQSAWNAYQSYNAAKETKKQNKANLSKANEAMYRQGVDQRNKIAGARRRQGMGLGNANNTGAMAGLVAANPYSEYRNYNIPY